MKDKHIRVDMDFCADPIWESEDGKNFVNGDIEDFIDLISESLFNELVLYQDLWENYHSYEWSYGTKILDIDFPAWEKSLAESLSQELPGDYSVYYYDLSLQKNVMVD